MWRCAHGSFIEEYVPKYRQNTVRRSYLYYAKWDLDLGVFHWHYWLLSVVHVHRRYSVWVMICPQHRKRIRRNGEGYIEAWIVHSTVKLVDGIEIPCTIPGRFVLSRPKPVFIYKINGWETKMILNFPMKLEIKFDGSTSLFSVVITICAILGLPIIVNILILSPTRLTHINVNLIEDWKRMKTPQCRLRRRVG